MPAKKKPYLSFEEAKEIVQAEKVASVKQFREWWTANKPKAIPSRPNRVYKEWNGWNDFLGVNNKFAPIQPYKRYRPYAEAVLWVHKLQLENKHQWDKWCAANKDEKPEDIPLRPDLAYQKDWVSWGHWLGNTMSNKVEAQQAARKEAAIFYCIHEAGYTQNIFTFGVEQNGKIALRERWEKNPTFTVIRVFKYRAEVAGVIQNILEQRSTPMYGSQYVRIVPNIHQLLWDLSTILDLA